MSSVQPKLDAPKATPPVAQQASTREQQQLGLATSPAKDEFSSPLSMKSVLSKFAKTPTDERKKDKPYSDGELIFSLLQPSGEGVLDLNHLNLEVLDLKQTELFNTALDHLMNACSPEGTITRETLDVIFT
jgi:hypothetical protein